MHEIFFKVEISEEYYTYDLASFVADMGGNLGLFLGWSILSIIECFDEGLIEYLSQFKAKLRYSQKK